MNRFIILTSLLLSSISLINAKQFKLVTDPAQLTPNDEILLVNTANRLTIHHHQEQSSDGKTQLTTYPVNITDNVINADELMLTFTIEGQTDNWKLHASNLRLNDNNSISDLYYLNCIKSSLEYLRLQANNSVQSLKFSFNDNFVDITYNLYPDYHMQFIDNSTVHLTQTTDPFGNPDTAISIFKAINNDEQISDLPNPYLYYSETLSWNGSPNAEIHEQDFGDIKTTYSIGNGKWHPRTTTKSIRLYKDNFMTIILPENSNITSLNINISDKSTNTNLKCNGIDIPTISNSTSDWYTESPTNIVTLSSYNTDGEALDNISIGSITINYYVKPDSQEKIAPDPIITYDQTSDMISMQILDSDGNTINDSFIFYGFTEVDQTPEKESINQIFAEPAQISQLCGIPGTYDLWVYAHIDGYTDSPMTKYGPFIVEPFSHGSDELEYKLHTNNDLIEFHWYIITNQEGTNALGSAIDSSFSAPELKIVNIGTPHYWAKKNEFDGKGILEFQYINGQFIEKRSQKPLQPTIPTTYSNNNAQISVEKTDENNHIITIDGQQLGFNGTTFGFTKDHNQLVRIFTTGKSVSTDSDIIIDDEETTTTIYYNLQGHQVHPNKKGLYIKQQGNKTRKIVIK